MDYYNYNGTYTETITALAAGIGFFFWLIMMALIVIGIVITWKFFEKCGEAGWKSLIPIYNVVVLYQIGGLPGWYVALAFIPCVGPLIALIFTIKCYINIAKAFNKSSAFAVGLIFLNPIFLGILAFDPKEQYNGIMNNN